MKFSYFVLSVSLVHKVVCTGVPLFYADPQSAKDCIEWYNHEFPEKSCEQLRDYFAITPEQFHQWNPSLGLDCKPWNDFQSYCIVTQERLDNTPKPSTSSSKISTTTTTSSTPAPSPTAWTDRGCYEETPRRILQHNMTPDGDTSLTIPKCKDTCYRQGYQVAGVQEGNQCWCDNYIPGEWAPHETECNMPCPGDKATICGGKQRLNIFLAKENKTPSSTVTSVGGSSTTTSATDLAGSTSNIGATSLASSTSSVEGDGASKTSGARRNSVIFWQNW